MMNFERKITADANGVDATTMSYGVAKDEGRSRWMIIGALALVVVLLVAAWYAFGSSGAAPAEKGTGAADISSAPAVTVIVPGVQQVDRVISATGTIAARREMPVGVAGEGGQVVRVLVEPGQWVAAGQVLATVDRSVQTQEANSLAAQIRVAQADAKLAQAELDRAQALVGRGFISKADVDRRIATRDAANARVRVAQATLGQSAARNRRLDIRAPAAGLVLTREVEPGQVISAGSGVLFRMARGGEMELLAQVGETELAVLPVGARASVTPVGATGNFTGQIWQISPVIDATSRQGTARIALAYAPGLRPGGFAEARIISGSQQVPLLPESAVQNDAKGDYVYLVGAENKIVRRDVTVGEISSEGVPIVAGLTGNERVVQSAAAFLNPGEVVRPTKPVASLIAAPAAKPATTPAAPTSAAK